MMPILHLPGEMMPGQFGPIRRERGISGTPSPHHVEHRNSFGDADDEFDLGVGGFHDRVGRERRRNKDHGRVRRRSCRPLPGPY